MSAKNPKWRVLLPVSVAVGIMLMVSLSSAQPNHDAQETEEEIEYLKSEIARLKAQPELRISGTAIHRTQKDVILWVYERTPENQQLHGTMIDGWMIIVAESPKPSVLETLTHPPCVWILAGCLIVIVVWILVTYRGRVKPHLCAMLLLNISSKKRVDSCYFKGEEQIRR
jgi:hypothetical protein